jgi:hypothetical protein
MESWVSCILHLKLGMTRVAKAEWNIPGIKQQPWKKQANFVRYQTVQLIPSSI